MLQADSARIFLYQY